MIPVVPRDPFPFVPIFHGYSIRSLGSFSGSPSYTDSVRRRRTTPNFRRATRERYLVLGKRPVSRNLSLSEGRVVLSLRDS